jgi:hypothetical protein
VGYKNPRILGKGRRDPRKIYSSKKIVNLDYGTQAKIIIK